MYVANTHLKPVIGIDIHFVNLPFPFVPLPHPYIGLVIDPFDYIPFIGATVKVNGVPRGNTDTMGMIITFVHIPFGAGFTIFPIIGHDSQNFFGSKKVMVDGAPMSGAGYMLMTCNDIGLPLSFRPGRKFIPIPSLYLPTSFCIPLQWGPPVNVGGPLVPHFSLMALLKAFAFGSFLKVLGKVGGKLLKKLSSKVSSKSSASSKLKSALCKMGFEPVDLITGRVNYEYTDFEIPGPIPLKWTRNWDSDSSINGLLGHGTHLCYDRYIKMWLNDDVLELLMPDGRAVAFPLLAPGQEFYHAQEKLLLRRKQNGHFLLDDYDAELYFHFNHQSSSDKWHLSFIENYSGNRIQFHYNNRKLIGITDSAGRQLLLQTDTQNRIIRVEVNHKEVKQVLISYQYNDEGDLVTISDALEQPTNVVYNNHLMVEKTDRNGQRFYWKYDQQKRCVHTYGEGGLLEGWIEYKKGYNTVTNSLKETTTYWYDENNLCIQQTDDYGNSQYTEYTENFEIYRQIDEQGNITGYIYNDEACLIEKISPDGSSVRFQYTDTLQPKIVIYPDGNSETYGYDDARRIRFINYPNGNTISYQYNEDGQLVSIIENGSSKTLLSYDDDGNMSRMELPDKSVTSWQYNALGRCVKAVNAEGQLRQFRYDKLGRLNNMYLPDGNKVRLEYNAYEEVVSAVDKHTKVQFEYTPLGSVKKRSQDGKEIHFSYDTKEQLRTIVNEAGKHYQLNYNKRGEILGERGFDDLQRFYKRDAAGKVVKVERPGNRFVLYEYDASGRIIRAEYSDGTWETYRYDRNGSLIEANNENGAVKLERNKLGLVTTEWQDSYWVKSSYDKFGNRIGLQSVFGANVQMKRNELGQAVNMQVSIDKLLWNCQTKFNSAGQEIEKIFPGAVKSESGFDESGRPSEQKITSNGVIQSWKKYTWDANDRLKNIFDAISKGSTLFKHDAIGNLIFAQYADNSVVHRSADSAGNLYKTKEQSDRKYSSAGALLESKLHWYKYDEEGNLISKTEKATQKKWHYHWQGNGLLAKVQRPDGEIVSFKYDALGRRIEKVFEGKITRFLWERNVPIHEWTYPEKERPKTVVDKWGTISTDKAEPIENVITWAYNADSYIPVAKVVAGKAYSIISDYLGTPQLMFDDVGKKVWDGVMDIYGACHTLAGRKSDLPFRYQGQYEDVETGLYYNRFRYYSPEEGMYISQDLIKLKGGYQFYKYIKDVNNDVDVLGLMPLGNPINQGHHIVPHQAATDLGVQPFNSQTGVPSMYWDNNQFSTGNNHSAMHGYNNIGGDTKPLVKASHIQNAGLSNNQWLGTLEAHYNNPAIQGYRGDLHIINADGTKGRLIKANVSPKEAWKLTKKWAKQQGHPVKCK